MSTDLETDLITIAEAAKYLRVSMLTVKRWIAQGRLPAHRVGPRQIRIRKQDIAKVVKPATTRPMGVTMDKERQDIWAGYDLQAVKEALHKSAGSLVGVDRRTLLEHIHAARGQASRGRPA